MSAAKESESARARMPVSMSDEALVESSSREKDPERSPVCSPLLCGNAMAERYRMPATFKRKCKMRAIRAYYSG